MKKKYPTKGGMISSIYTLHTKLYVVVSLNIIKERFIFLLLPIQYSLGVCEINENDQTF